MYGNISSAISLTGSYRAEPSMTSGLTRPIELLSELNASIISPIIRTAFNNEKSRPSSLLIHPSITIFRIDSRSLPRSPRTMKTMTRISANAIILRTCSDAVMYCDTHSVTMFANRAEAQMPAIIEIIEIAWEMKPFLSPCIMAGMRAIKIMASKMFINLLKMIIFAG